MDAGFYEYRRRLHGGIMEGMIVASSLAKIDGWWSTPFPASDERLPIPSVSPSHSMALFGSQDFDNIGIGKVEDWNAMHITIHRILK